MPVSKQVYSNRGRTVLKNRDKADLDKDGKLSSYEKKRGAAIEKNLMEMCGPIMEYLNELQFSLQVKN